MNKERRSFLDMVNASALSPLLGFSSPASAQNKQPEELWLDAFKTNIALKGEYCWIDDDRFVVTTNMPGLELEVRQLSIEAKTRLAIVNFLEKTIIYIENNTQLIKFNRIDKSLLIGNSYYDEKTQDPRFGEIAVNKIFTNLRSVKVNSNNIVEIIETFPEGTKLPNHVPEYPKGVRSKSVDDGVKGYLIEDESQFMPPSKPRANREDSFNHKHNMTIWLRPGKPPLPLPINFDEIDDCIYIDCLDKYLLRSGDPTITQLSAEQDKNWDKPYRYPPFWLLGKNGEIDKIPYPESVL